MLDDSFLVVQLFDGCSPKVRIPMRCACNRAGFVKREGEGSTGPSRGEHRLTVYRAHAIFGEKRQLHETSRIWAALPGERREGALPQE